MRKMYLFLVATMLWSCNFLTLQPNTPITITNSHIMPRDTETPIQSPTPIMGTATPNPEISVKDPALSDTNEYVVQPGDTLSELAVRFGLTVRDLVGVNHIIDPDRILSGQTLVIEVWIPEPPHPISCDGKEIDVVLLSQRTYAFENCMLVREFIVSTGLSRPTPTGTYKIETKLLSDDMSGPGYNLPGVPFVMYFDVQGDSFHGTYWHHNFGTPMSHGCVNMDTSDAEWLYNWASLGTRVHISAE